MVPRTFLGPLAVSSVAYPVVMALKGAGTSKLWSQLVGIHSLFVFIWCLFKTCQLRSQSMVDPVESYWEFYRRDFVCFSLHNFSNHCANRSYRTLRLFVNYLVVGTFW